MKVLFATHFFPPGQAGGTEAYTLGLARALRKAGHEPFVICAEGWDQGGGAVPAVHDTTYDDIPVRRLAWNWRATPSPFVNLYANPAVDVAFHRYVEEIGPEVAHFTSCYSLGAGIIPVAHQAGLRTVLTLTDFWFVCPRHTLLRGDGSLCNGPESALACQKCMASPTRVYRLLRQGITADVAAQALLHASRWRRFEGWRAVQGYIGKTMQEALGN